MSNNLTLTSATFGTGKFGSGLTGGYGQAASNSMVPGNAAARTYTVEGWGKTTTGSVAVLIAQDGVFYIDVESGKASGKVWTSAGNVAISTTVTVNDGVWHHFRLCVDGAAGGAGLSLWIDGALAWSNSAQGGGLANATGFSVANLAGSYAWAGSVDEVALWNKVLNTTAFTPPAAAYTGSESGLVALYHLESDGTDSASTAVVDTTPPTASGAAVANSTPTVVAITMSEALDSAYVPAASAFTVSGHTVTGVAVSGTVINLTVSAAFVSGEAARTVTYTQPGSANARDVAGNLLANFSGLSITNNVAATAGDTTPPTFVGAQVTNAQPSVVVLTFNEALGAATPAASAFAVSGGKTVSSVSAPSGATISLTVSAPYTNGDTITVAYTKPGTNPLQDVAGNQAATFGAQPVTNNVGAVATGFIATTAFSPGNWYVEAAQATAVNPGASFRTVFAPGSTLTLSFDMSVVTGGAGFKPRLVYAINGGPTTEVDIAASITITPPGGPGGFAHSEIEVWFKAADAAAGRWSTLGAAVRLTSITGATTLSKPVDRGPKWIAFGDSISEGTVTNAGYSTVTTNNDSRQTWIYKGAKQAGVEMGIVGFGGQGLVTSGAGGVPSFPSAYNLVYAGAPRTFPSDLAGIVINHGTNDGNSTQQTAVATTVLNNLLAAIPSTAKIVVMRPFNGFQAAAWQAAIAACTAPARVAYVDTTGWYDTADTGDTGLHPNGYFGTLRAPDTATAIKNAMLGAPATTLRTFSTTLATGKDAQDNLIPAANLTGLKIRCYNVDGSLAFSTDAGTSNASGFITLAGQSTAAASASCLMTVRSTDHHWSNFVTVT